MVRKAKPSNFEPVLLIEVEVGRPVEIPAVKAAHGGRYERIQVLVREDRVPLGHFVVDLPETGLSSEGLEVAIQGFLRHSSPTRLRRVHRDSTEPVTVVIATRSRPEELRRCLASLDAQTHSEFEVVVVENTPHPDSAQGVVAETLVKGRRPRYVHEPTAGLAIAHNAGLAQVSTDLVAFTDDDVEADPEWLVSLAGGFAARPHVACVTGLIYPASLDHPSQLLIEALGFGKHYEPRVFDLGDHRPSDGLFPVAIGRCGSGANMAFRTDVLRELGGFDPALGAGSPGGGGDDLAAFFDIVTAGHGILYEPAAIIRHHHEARLENVASKIRQYGTGLGAYLTRCVVQAPMRAPKLFFRIPKGLRHLSRSGTESMARLPLRPRLAGLLLGPTAYLRGRRAAKRAAK